MKLKMQSLPAPLAIVLLLLTSFTSPAQNIPSPKAYLGYEIGENFSRHHQVIGYFQALANAATSQIKLQQYGATNEGRPLMLAFISSAENMARLDDIRQNNLRHAGMLSGNADMNSPAIVWLSYNVHGNETSSSEAAMKTAHFLLTDSRAAGWLKNTIVVIDPCINPDGRDRYVNWYNSVKGKQMNPDPQSREHSEPWPGGRSNHYNFDLNRDWAWQTQVETQQRIKVYNQWMPHIHVDFHEQGYNEPYYFAPAAEPFHEVITPWQRSFQESIGRNHAKYFDLQGWLYFTKERFDLFYPSYGDTWPTYNGAIGMTYEQGGHSRAGLGVINEDGDTLTLADRADHHFTTGISTVEISSMNAGKLVENFNTYFADATKNGAGTYKSFVVKGNNAQSKMDKLIQLLQRNGITVGYANNGTAKGFNYASQKEESFNLERGDLVISTVQPRGSLVQVLFEPSSMLSDSATYDITAWSLPYAHGLQAYAVKEKLAVTPGMAVPAIAEVVTGKHYGYAVAWQSMKEAAFLSSLLQAGVKARFTEKPFVLNNKDYAAGSLILLKTSNAGVIDFDLTVQRIAQQHAVRIVPINTGFADKGVDFGSPDVKSILPPKVAMISGDGVSSLGAGEVWHYFDTELQYPVSLINLNDAARMRWDNYDVVILPDGFRYQQLLAKDGELAGWVQRGGKVILMENAVAQAARADWGIKTREDVDAKKDKEDEYANLKKYADRERDGLKEFNPGSIFRVHLDNTHPLAFGYGEEYYTLKGDGTVYQFMKDGWNVGVIKKNPLMAGFAGSALKKQLQDGLIFGHMNMGRGNVIYLADDILFREFWENGKLLMANAIFMVGRAGSSL